MWNSTTVRALTWCMLVLGQSLHLAAAPPEVPTSPADEVTAPGKGLRYYGHYWVESTTFGSHLDEVGRHCNVHFVEGIDGLKKCAAKNAQCLMQVRWEFFQQGGRDGDRAIPNPLREDYEAQWNKTADEVTPFIEHVEAFYMMDEPYWNGVTPEDLDTSIPAVKARFPEKPVMVVFAYPCLTKDLVTPERADWLGFDCYETISEISKHMKLLKSKLKSHQRMFLVPQSFINKAAPTDEALAKLNRQYYTLANSEPLVIGLLNYGLYSDAKGQKLPMTLKAQREISELITKTKPQVMEPTNVPVRVPR